VEVNKGFIIPDNLRLPGLKAIFTTRSEGGKDGRGQGFSLSFTDGIEREEVVQNRSRVASFIGVSLDSLLLPVQRHTDKVAIIMERPETPIEADAIITPLNGIVLGVLVADCAPILAYDPQAGVIAAIHAGWRGTAGGIIKKTLAFMYKEFNTSPSEIIISIGPSIRWCCYEVGPDVLKAIEKETGNPAGYSKEKGDGKYCLDIARANQIQASSLGVKDIWISEECTCCHPERFYSYRYLKGQRGRQGGFIGMIGRIEGCLLKKG